MAQMPKIMQDVLRDSEVLRKKKQIVAQMMTARSQFEPTWKLLSRYINPMRGRFDEEDKSSDGKRRDYYLLEPYPMEACQKCGAGLTGRAYITFSAVVFAGTAGR